MANSEFILQGLTNQTHANTLREIFDIPDIESVILSIAFVSESGVQQIEKELKAHAAHVTVFAGIRNDITSHQALVLLQKLGCALYTVDTGSRAVLFHPKVYLAAGDARARLIVGSANLTLGGLNNNIEAGICLDLNFTSAADKAVVDLVKAQFSILPVEFPKHVVRVGAIADLDQLLESGRLVDEMATPPPRPTTATGRGAGDSVPRIKLKVTPLRRRLAPAKAAPKNAKSQMSKAGVPAPKLGTPTIGIELELVWESKPLTRRDLTIPTGTATNATGSINLDKGLLPAGVDHRSYFRKEVFSALTWAKRSKTVHEAYAKFQLILKGISYGEFDLAIRHSISTTSKGYRQRNAMTRLSWGPIRPYIARPDLLLRTLALYRDKVNSRRFVLDLD